MEHTAARDDPFVGSRLPYAQSQILLQLLLQAVVDMARGAVFAFAAEERRVVDGEKHGHGGLVDGDGRQRFGIVVIADGVAYLKVVQAYDGANIAAGDCICAHMAHALEGVKLLDLGLLHGAVAVSYGDIHALADGAAVHTAHGDAAGIVGVVERGDEHLRRALQHLGRGDGLDDGVE